MNVPFFCMNQIILVSSWRDKSFLLNEFKVNERDLTFTFSNYVKSQMHYNVIGPMNGIPFRRVVNAYNFLKGESEFSDDVLMMLNLFYRDVLNFLWNNLVPCTASVIVDADLPIKTEVFDPGKIKEEVLGVISLNDREEMLEGVHKCSIPEVFTFCRDKKEMLERIDPFVVMAIIQHQGTKKVSQIEWR